MGLPIALVVEELLLVACSHSMPTADNSASQIKYSYKKW